MQNYVQFKIMQKSKKKKKKIVFMIWPIIHLFCLWTRCGMDKSSNTVSTCDQEKENIGFVFLWGGDWRGPELWYRVKVTKTVFFKK